MSERPLHEYEIIDIKRRLEDIKKEYERLGNFIVSLEGQLKRGTAWMMDPDVAKRQWEEVKESARISDERDKQQEIETYGRLLTKAERHSWAKRPPELMNKQRVVMESGK